MRNIFLIAFAILSISIYGQGISTKCTYCPPSPVGQSGKVIGSNGSALVWQTGGGGGGTNIYNSDGTLTADRIVTLGNKILTFQDSVNIQNIIRINDADLAFQVGSITDSFQSTVNIFNTTQENGIASSSTGIEIGHYMDSTSSIDKLSYNGLVFQQGVFDNLGTKENITTEMNIFSPSLGRDIGYLGMHFGHWEYFISDTLSGASEFPQGHGVYAMDSVITATHVTARSGGGEYLTKYATKFKADTAFSFLLDSSNTPVLSVHRNGIKIVDGTQGNGKVLTSNASGLASWQTGGGSIAVRDSAWMKVGNTGLTDGVDNFLGTTDDVPIRFTINGTSGGIIQASGGNTFFGANTPYPSGDNNVGIGLVALTNLVGGTENVAIGAGSFSACISGNNNTGVGYASLSNVLGSDNTSVGHNTGLGIINGINNLFLASGADATGDYSNVISAGYGAIALSSNEFAIGTQDHLNFELNGATVGYVLSPTGANTQSWQGIQTLDASGIPAYANNAAAVVGIGAGKLYYTDVAGEYIVKISH